MFLWCGIIGVSVSMKGKNKMISHNRVTYLIVVERNYDDCEAEVYRGSFEMPCGHSLYGDELKKRVCEDITSNICVRFGD